MFLLIDHHGSRSQEGQLPHPKLFISSSMICLCPLPQEKESLSCVCRFLSSDHIIILPGSKSSTRLEFSYPGHRLTVLGSVDSGFYPSYRFEQTTFPWSVIQVDLVSVHFSHPVHCEIEGNPMHVLQNIS